MANIIEILEKQKEKGVAYITPEGDFITEEKFNKLMLKQYSNAIAYGELEGSILSPHTLNYEEFIEIQVDNRYWEIDRLIDFIKYRLSLNESMVCFDELVEPDKLED